VAELATPKTKRPRGLALCERTENKTRVMIRRRMPEGERFVALLRRLDCAIANAWDQETTIDEVNG
jgi:hypothetical protein